MFGLIILGFILNDLNTPSKELTGEEKEKEKKLSELRYDDFAKEERYLKFKEEYERRYLKFKEEYEFQERLRKEMEIKRKD